MHIQQISRRFSSRCSSILRFSMQRTTTTKFHLVIRNWREAYGMIPCSSFENFITFLPHQIQAKIEKSIYDSDWQQIKPQSSILIRLCESNQRVTGGLSSQRASNAGRVAVSWRHRDKDTDALIQTGRKNQSSDGTFVSVKQSTLCHQRKCHPHLSVKYLISAAPNPKTKMFLVSSCSCIWAIYWGHVLSREWRCSWSSADRRCSKYIWVINN